MTGITAFLIGLMRLNRVDPDTELTTLKARRDRARDRHEPVEVHNRAIRALMEARLAAVVASGGSA